MVDLNRGVKASAPQNGRATTTVPAAARLLGIDVRTARARILRGELPGGATAGRHRLRWFVYSDALMTPVEQPYDHGAEADRHTAMKQAASLLLQAHTELGVGLKRDGEGLDHLGRVRAELAAYEHAVTGAFNHLRAALALINDGSSGSGGSEVLG